MTRRPIYDREPRITTEELEELALYLAYKDSKTHSIAGAKRMYELGIGGPIVRRAFDLSQATIDKHIPKELVDSANVYRGTLTERAALLLAKALEMRLKYIPPRTEVGLAVLEGVSTILAADLLGFRQPTVSNWAAALRKEDTNAL